MKCISIALLIVIVLPLIVLMSLLMLPVDIQAATNTTEILVNISELAQITVSPSTIAWLQVAPRSNGTVTTITITNIGSTSFSNGIYVSVDSWANATNNPTANDDISKYMAGTFLVMKNSSHGDTEYFFVNQILWNESTYPSPSNPTAGAHSWGYYNNMSNQWLWELKGNSTIQCTQDATYVSLKIVKGAGDDDLGGTVTTANWVANDSTWSIWAAPDGPLEKYCIAAYKDCTRLMIYYFDRNSSLPACVNDTYIGTATLNPGGTATFYAKPHVWSVPAGSALNSTVTFTAE